MKKNFIYIGIGLVAIAVVVGISFSITNSNENTMTESFPELEFTYTASNSKLQQNLGTHGISMSSLITLVNKNKINEFCSFFGDEAMQNQVDYCTSTELRNSEGEFLGDIHMVGSRKMPKIVLAVIQTNPLMQNLDDIKTVYSTVIENLVCDCWDELKPGGIETVEEWIDKQRDFHTSDVKPTSKTTLRLEGMHLQIELTTNTKGYLWKLIISG